MMYTHIYIYVCVCVFNKAIVNKKKKLKYAKTKK